MDMHIYIKYVKMGFGGSINYVDKQGGEGVSQMLTILHKLMYLVNLSSKGEEVKNPQNFVDVVYEWPLSFLSFSRPKISIQNSRETQTRKEHIFPAGSI